MKFQNKEYYRWGENQIPLNLMNETEIIQWRLIIEYLRELRIQRKMNREIEKMTRMMDIN